MPKRTTKKRSNNHAKVLAKMSTEGICNLLEKIAEELDSRDDIDDLKYDVATDLVGNAADLLTEVDAEVDDE